MTGIIYVLTNEAMPGLVKIGKTTQDMPQVRMDQLYTTGVPVPFNCSIAMKVEDPDAIEKALHTAFGPNRINSKREFFEISAEQAVAVIRQLGSEDVTPEVSAENESISVEERASSAKLKTRRPNLNFREMGLPSGATLISVETGREITIADDRHVLLDGEVVSLTRATFNVLDLGYNVQPSPHWTYNGRNLSDIYNETYPLEEY